MLSAARRSRFGVCAVLAPRKPIRSARVESRVISTRLGLGTAAANEKLRPRKTRLAPGTNLRIMTVSVKAAPPLIKICNDQNLQMTMTMAVTMTWVESAPGADAARPCSLDVHRTPRTIYVPAPRDILLWRCRDLRPSFAGKLARKLARKPGQILQIILA